jgi:GT2 family glycosyltransferase
VHREVFDRVGTFDTELPACEDYDLWLRIFQRYPAGLVTEHCVIKYGGHDDQLSKSHWGMDRFRVRSLARLLESGCLTSCDRIASIRVLHQKCEILVNGMRRRGNSESAARYEELMRMWPLPETGN